MQVAGTLSIGIPSMAGTGSYSIPNPTCTALDRPFFAMLAATRPVRSMALGDRCAIPSMKRPAVSTVALGVQGQSPWWGAGAKPRLGPGAEPLGRCRGAAGPSWSPGRSPVSAAIAVAGRVQPVASPIYSHSSRTPLPGRPCTLGFERDDPTKKTTSGTPLGAPRPGIDRVQSPMAWDSARGR